MVKLTNTVSAHPNQVNTFHNMEEVNQAYESTVKGRSYKLMTSTTNKETKLEVGLNEIKTVLEYQDVINPAVRNLVLVANSYDPKLQFKNFRVIEFEGDKEKIHQLDLLCEKIANWSGFKFCQQNEKLGLEGFTEWTHTGASVIDTLNAGYFARFLNSEEEKEDSWEKFKLTPEFGKTEAFRTTIEEITRPTSDPSLASNQEGMSISTALQGFRRKSPQKLSQLLVAEGNSEAESLLEDKLRSVKEKLDQMKAILSRFQSIEEAYRQLKAGSKEMIDANNLRRQIGGTGFLFAFQQAIKTQVISEGFFKTHSPLISDLVSTCNKMDQCNFEINLGKGEGAYKGDVIPSAYAFFNN